MFRQKAQETLAFSWYGGSLTADGGVHLRQLLLCWPFGGCRKFSDEILDFSDVVNNLELKCE